jgi:hypothetical protein
VPSFVNHRERYILTTSYKVMYSTLSRQAGLEKLPPRSLYVCRLWLDTRLRHYMLVRDPYARLASFYSNKIAETGRRVAGGHRWQLCQRIFFPHVGVSGDEDPLEIDARLKALPFERFVGLLERVAWLDHHLIPQAESRWRRVRGTRFGVRLPVHRFLKMESDLDCLRSVLRLDLTIRENASETRAVDALFTPQMRAVVQRVYERDFVELGYPMG